ncbi:MAG: hypothetical protein HRU20_03620 [Pseudomonadales bacterium]|nr:hypothetical protein [Pseudomonadales bacterium]
MSDNNKDNDGLGAFEDILFSSDDELSQRKKQEKPALEPSESTPSFELAFGDDEAEDLPTKEAEPLLEAADEIPTLDAPPVTDSKAKKTNAAVKAASKALGGEYDDQDIPVEDALFSSAEALEKALDDKPEKAVKKKVQVVAETEEHTFKVDFDAFIHGDENVTVLQTQAATATGLAITGKRLNASLVADVDWPVPEMLDEDLLQEFQQFRQLKQAEKDQQQRFLDEKPAGKKALLQKLYRGNKQRVDSYLGRDLPARDIALNFKFPPVISAKETGALLTGNQIQEIFAKKKDSLLTVFKKSDRALSVITLRDVSAGKLQHLLHAFYQPFVEKTQAFISFCHKNSAIPLVDERLEIAELCASSLKLLIVAYKQLYAKYYEANNLIYGSKHDVANQTAWRLLELLCLEQQVNASLYRAHPIQSSATFNKIYNVLGEYEDDFIYQEQQSLVFNERLSLQKMFVRFQIELAFDISGVSAALHRRLRAYWAARSALILPLTAQQLSSAWVDECWIIGHEHDGRARFTEDAQIQDLPASYVHIEPFLQQLQKDYAHAIDVLQRHKLSELPLLIGIPAFELLQGEQVLQILTVLNQQIVSIEKNLRLPKYTVFNKFDIDVDLFAGFTQSQNFFQRLQKSRTNAHLGGPGQANKDESVISKKKKRGGNGGYWDVAMEDDKGIFLQTTETKLCPTLDVGQLILLVKYSDDNLKPASEPAQSIPVRVMGLERVAANKIILSGDKLGDDCIAVQLRNDQDQCISAFVAVQKGHRQLIADMQWRFHSGDKFTMILPDGSESEIGIAALQSISSALQVFSIY